MEGIRERIRGGDYNNRLWNETRVSRRVREGCETGRIGPAGCRSCLGRKKRKRTHQLARAPASVASHLENQEAGRGEQAVWSLDCRCLRGRICDLARGKSWPERGDEGHRRRGRGTERRTLKPPGITRNRAWAVEEAGAGFSVQDTE